MNRVSPPRLLRSGRIGGTGRENGCWVVRAPHLVARRVITDRWRLVDSGVKLSFQEGMHGGTDLYGLIS